MKILLPPSETKNPGGSGTVLDLDSLSLPALAPEREQVVSALVAMAGDAALSQRVLKLSDRQLGEIEHNRTLRVAPTMPAVDRYTGVLYDALDAVSLDAASRRWLGHHVWVHSAPFGPVGALDEIPSYRLAAAAALPGVAPLRRHWAQSVTAAIAREQPRFIVDLRSEAYVALGPIPASVSSVYVRVVTEQGRALNHFNKKAKGELVRALAEERPRVSTLESLTKWASVRGIELRADVQPGIVNLVVAS
ncbi:YaaA family protein [Microbacterium sp. A196]|uniref:YaaA family protein n=1 Tax=unclassified Microbacterium TaxID=2609290 RepID=UPI003FD27012